MNKIIKNITTVMISIVVWSLVSTDSAAQCKSRAAAGEVAGQLSINGNKVVVDGDGNGVATASNNIPIKICEGELITLKSTLAVSSGTDVNYWVTSLSSYQTLSAPPITPVSASANYNPATGGVSVDLRMTDKTASTPDGIRFYGGPGKYVITQYQTATSLAGSTITTHTCQVIEVIAPQQPVATVTACSGQEVQITLPANAANNFDDYEIQFNAISGPGNPILKTGKPGSYPFTIKSGTTLPDAQDRIITIKGLSVTGGCPAPLNNLGQFAINGATMFRPAISTIVGTVNKGEFKIDVSGQASFGRNIYMRESSSTYNYTTPFKTYGSLAATPFETTTLQVPNGDKQYCFQAESVDLACAASSNLLSAEEVCTTPAKVTAVSNKNVVEWLPAAAPIIGALFNYYQVERLNPDGTTDKVFPAITNISELKLDDNSVICGQEYTYRVETNYNQKSLSQIIKVKAVSDDVPPKIPRVFATMTNDAKNAFVQGQFDPSNIPVNIKANAYKFYRANTINGTYSLLNTGNTVFKDLTANVEDKSYCYYMTWTNLCDKESDPSEKICTINLKASGAAVNWTKESSISLGTDSYIVQRVNPTNGTNIKELASNLQNIYTYNTQILPETEGQEIYIQIEARPVGWNVIGGSTLPTTLSNIVKIFRPSLAISPQIFTPNGDGQNDKFMVRGKFIKELKMTIYDRWGNAIFYEESNSYPIESNQNETTVIGWDGTMNNGNKALEGSYAYKIEIIDTVGQTTVKEGALLLAY
ncbi:gliding motility-associated-like protein [Arcicella aurantiaca]|uniref:Gliding motility-associated-like protein n=1 Tax=Arcicella aurantiaca TaxID=591202 RepID=A0A316EEV7_9BACT|nr:gliding motility-associated C-terminal domain-containing protein [Arcicella aurantiaca]PWK28610.1 gliding motility-associated-like protein [Arcicella aurantiaca]